MQKSIRGRGRIRNREREEPYYQFKEFTEKLNTQKVINTKSYYTKKLLTQKVINTKFKGGRSGGGWKRIKKIKKIERDRKSKKRWRE